MLAWCGEHGFDLCLIETMPMGEISEDRTDQYLPLSIVRGRLRKTWTLEDTDYRTGGPARYFNVKETGRRIGFITPMTHNFCESCNRVRLTCTGTLYMCLGQDDSAEFRPLLRAGRIGRRAGRCDPRGDRPQAKGPRLHHRPAARQALGRPAHERDRRLNFDVGHGQYFSRGSRALEQGGMSGTPRIGAIGVEARGGWKPDDMHLGGFVRAAQSPLQNAAVICQQRQDRLLVGLERGHARERDAKDGA